MAARLAVEADARERLRRLSVLFAVELRLKIVAELYIREMSAKQFFAEFGGGSLARVSQNFTRLEDEGWLRFVREEGAGGSRRGGVERFYRAAEPPFIDADGWALLPYSVRFASSWNLFKQIAPRLRADLIEWSSQGSRARELTCRTFTLDEEGYRRATAAARAQFMLLYEEQEDARRRAHHSGEELIRADVLVLSFQAPSTGTQGEEDDLLVPYTREPLVPFSARLAPILGDEVRRDILSQLNEREMSVSQFHREFGGTSRTGVHRRFTGLADGAWAARVNTLSGGQRRGAREQFFRATKPVADEYDPCADAPRHLAGSEAWRTFERVCISAKESMLAGAFDARPDRVVVWSTVSLDLQGWDRIVRSIESTEGSIAEEEMRAMQRMGESGESPTRMTVALAAFEAAQETTKAP